MTLSYEIRQRDMQNFGHFRVMAYPPEMHIVIQVSWDKLTIVSLILSKLRYLASEITIELRMH